MMHLRRRISYRDESLDHFSTEPASFWLRSRRWDFWVANELEAFAVIARHDIEHIEAVSLQTTRRERRTHRRHRDVIGERPGFSM